MTGVITKISDNDAAAVKLGPRGSEKISKKAPLAVVDVPPRDGLPARKFTLVNIITRVFASARKPQGDVELYEYE